MKLAHSIKSKSGDEIAHSGRKINAAMLKEIQKAKINEIEVDITDLEGAWVAERRRRYHDWRSPARSQLRADADKLAKILIDGVVETSTCSSLSAMTWAR